MWTSTILSIDSFKYYIIFVDHYTRYTWFYPLKQKSHIKQTFITFKALVENHFDCKIQNFYSDNGGEFIALRSFFSDHGISHLTSPPHTPEHNGVAERKHQHIVETGLTLLHQALIPTTYWTYSFAAAVYLINRMSMPQLNQQSPYLKLFGKPPNYLKLCVFGCMCFPWLRPYAKHKLDDRSLPCVFLGYSLTQSTYLCLHQQTGRIYTSRHVQFVETTFPFQTPSREPNKVTESPPIFAPPTSIPLHTAPLVQPTSTAGGAPPSPIVPSPAPSVPTEQTNNVVTETNSTDIISSAAQVPPEPIPPAPIPTTPDPTSPPQNSQQNQPPTPLPSPSSSSSSSLAPPPPPQNVHPMKTRAKNNILKPNKKLTLLSETKPFIPKTVNQAMRDEKWRNAMGDEYNAQIRNQTFELVPPAPHQNVIPTKWLYTIKYLANGTIDRYKTRWVARGDNQEYGINYAETFSPVLKSISIWLVLQLAVTRSWGIKQLDVNNAFLQGTLSDEVYVSQPPGFVDPDKPHHVCRLKKALYCLKQAPRAWYQELKSFLCDMGCHNSVADTSVFIYIKGDNIVYVLVYVDDIIITASNNTLLDGVIRVLSARFSLKNPTNLNYFLGIEVTRTTKGLHMMQRKYIQDLLSKTEMWDAKPVTSPMATSPKLTLHSGTALDDPSEYRTVLGSLQYLSFTRPDIAYSVNRLSQLMHRPTDLHWQAAKRILRYLAGTISHGIYLSARSPLSLHVFSDADWAGDVDDFVSTNAYIMYLGSTPIAWTSKKQTGVARSSTEAEYRSVANTTAEIIWVCSLLSELGVSLPSIPTVYCDNVGATYLSANPVFHSRMKHLTLDFHFVRQNVQTGALRVSHISTHDQLADALTKPLPRQRFNELMRKIGVTAVPPS